MLNVLSVSMQGDNSGCSKLQMRNFVPVDANGQVIEPETGTLGTEQFSNTW